MKITEIIVSAGRTFNHPFESYSNLKPQVTLKATIEEGEDFEAATKELQAKAEGIVEDHKQNMLKSLYDLETMSRRQQEMASLESGIRKAQTRLDDIRKEYPSLTGKEQDEIPF